jgi:hypothetical protein
MVVAAVGAGLVLGSAQLAAAAAWRRAGPYVDQVVREDPVSGPDPDAVDAIHPA